MAIDYYGNVRRVMLDIKTYERLLRSSEKELNKLIQMQSPKAVKAMNYDKVVTQGGGRIENDLDILKRVADIKFKIDTYKEILKEKQKTLSELNALGKKYLTRLEERGKEDLKLRVFIAAYIEGKSNVEVMDEIQGYELQTIYNIKTEINKHFKHYYKN